MNNINKFRFEVQQLTITGNATASQPKFINFGRIANDIGRSVNVTAIKIASKMEMRVPTVNRRILLNLSLGLTNKYDEQTNIFEWIHFVQEPLTALNAEVPSIINETLGNFKDILFTLENFKTETQGGNAPRGEVYLNGRVFSQTAGSPDAILDTVIYLYYK